jgi:KDO2-lipid IV(A) lauroyltransferase
MPRRFLSPRYWPTWITLGFMRTAAWLPLPVLVAIGSAVGTVLYWLAGERRQVAAINLGIAFPELPAAGIRQLNRACFRNVAIGTLEIGLVWWSPQRVKAMTEIRGLENLEAARSRKQGAMLLTAHFTGIEVGLPVLSAQVTLQAMYKRPHNRLMDRFMERHRGKFTAVIASNNAPISLIRGLKRGHTMWYAPDQDFRGKDTVFAPLFGVEANALTAPARIAGMTGVSVMPSWVARKPWGGGYVLTILPPLSDFPTGDDYRDALTINQVTENLIRRNPEQYLWTHRRYKRRPVGGERLYPA